VYDPQTCSYLQTDQPFPSIGSQRAGLVVNPDTSVDIWFGPKSLPGKEAKRGADLARQGLVRDAAPVRAAGVVVRQELAPGKNRRGLLSTVSARSAAPRY